MIEYVMLLFVIIGIVFAAKNVFTGMRNFMQGYMGDYVKCLMAHGELPGRGVQDSDMKKNTTTSYICNKQYTFSIDTGFTASGTSTGSGGSGSGSGGDGANGANSNSANSSKNSSSKSGQGNDNEDSSSSDSEGSTSGASEESIANRERNRKSQSDSAASSRSSTSGLYANSNRPDAGELQTADGGSGRGSGEQSKVIGELSKGEDGSDSSSGSRSRSKYRGISGQMAELLEKNSKIAQTGSKNKGGESVVIAESDSTPGPTRTTMKLYLKHEDTKMTESAEETFSVGKLMKWILIIALIIIIVIFFGGQLLNYSKSDS